MTSNSSVKFPDTQQFNIETHEEEMELHWPVSDVPIEEALLKGFEAWVLRLLCDAMARPSQILNAVRRLERMKDLPLRKEKQARSLAMAEARIELRRRALELREAQMKLNREKHELAAAKAAARINAKAKPSPQTAASVPASLPKAAGPVVSPINLIPKPSLNLKDFSSQTESPLAQQTHEALAPKEQLRKENI